MMAQHQDAARKINGSSKLDVHRIQCRHQESLPPCNNRQVSVNIELCSHRHDVDLVDLWAVTTPHLEPLTELSGWSLSLEYLE
jgi:hypothetical protein